MGREQNRHSEATDIEAQLGRQKALCSSFMGMVTMRADMRTWVRNLLKMDMILSGLIKEDMGCLMEEEMSLKILKL